MRKKIVHVVNMNAKYIQNPEYSKAPWVQVFVQHPDGMCSRVLLRRPRWLESDSETFCTLSEHPMRFDENFNSVQPYIEDPA